MKFSNEIIKNLKDEKSYRIKRTYTLDPDVVIAFEKFCSERGLKYSQVIEKLMLAFISK